MTRLACTLALLIWAAQASAQTHVVPTWPNDFVYVGKTTLAFAPYPNDAFGKPIGDWKFGKGLALHVEPDGTIAIFAGSWNPQTVLRWKVKPAADGTFSGNAAFVRTLGPLATQGELIGIYTRDGTTLYGSFNSTYDGDPAIATTLARATIDPVTGLLVKGGSWQYANRSDKMTMGGLTAVPAWWRTQYQQGCDTLAGFGGYWSVVATGPVSMGPAATCFTLPSDAATPLPNVPVLGFPFSSSTTTWTPSTHRVDTDYNQRYGWGWWPATVPSGSAFGYWNPGDWLYQGCAWVDTGGLSGLVCLPELQEGCNWYGDNAVPPKPPVCNSTPGKAASLNSNRQRPWVFIYDPKDLGAVATGQQPQTAVQPVSQTPMTFAGITLPFPGLPDMNHIVAGVTFDPDSHLFAVLVRDSSTLSSRPTIFWYRAMDPLKPFTVVRTRQTTESLTVRAITEDDALQQAKQAPDDSWHPTTDVTSYTVPK
jgi:hypothetical protein